MSTHQFPEGTKIEVNGEEYITTHATTLNDGKEDVVDQMGKIHTYNTDGKEIDADGEVIKGGKSLKKTK